MGKLPIGLNTPLQPINAKEIPSAPLPALPSEQERTISLESEIQVDAEDEHKRETHNSLTANNVFNKHSDNEITSSKTLRNHIQKLSYKKEKQQTFITVFVWAYKQHCGRRVSYENLITAIKHEGLHDTNTRKHLSELAKIYFKVVDGHYEINPYDGEQRVAEIIKAIQDPEKPSTTTEPKKSSKLSKPKGQPSKKEVEMVQPWLEQPLKSLDHFDARQLDSAADWGAFGLYILTKILKVEEALDAGLVYAYLVKQFSAMSITRNNFVKRMGDTTSRFKKNTSGAYFLTPEAEKRTKELIEAAGNS